MTAIMSGLFALLGAFAGAWLSRRTEYEKWLRQERSVAFEDFLRELHELKNDISRILYEAGMADQEKHIAVSERFTKLDKQESIVRIYLDARSREIFSKNTKRIWSAYSPAINQSTRMNELQSATGEIQAMFEKLLH